MAYSLDAPVFADRYRFEPVNNDWDRGRSGFTHLVYDLKKKRLGVIKRADASLKEAVEGLKNEVAALGKFEGKGVPKVYETGEATYGSKNYFYIVIEYIDALRVEKNIKKISLIERAEIITQLFALLTKAHRMGIVNGDVDLKHLFWQQGSKQLTVIDWGNAKLGVNPKKKTEFSYDLARAAEVIFSLVTREGSPPPTGPIPLPEDSALLNGLVPVPGEFRELCQWAPRTPIEGAVSPRTAQELFKVSQDWQNAIQRKKAYKPRGHNQTARFFYGVVLFAVVAAALFWRSPFNPLTTFQTSTPDSAASNTSPAFTETVPPTKTELPTASATTTPSATLTNTATVTPTATAGVTPIPKTYTGLSPVLILNKGTPANSCWKNETNIADGINKLPNTEGLYLRGDNYWGFNIENNRTTDQYILTDFGTCLDGRNINALALNAWVARLDLQRESPDIPDTIEPGKEFGILIEDGNGKQRQYTVWIDSNNQMHLRVREDNEITFDDVVLVVDKESLKISGAYPRFYSTFPIQFFLEMDNSGLDILYLRKGLLQLPANASEIDPAQMIRIDGAVRSSLTDIKRIGLIGYGGDIQTVIWPLSFWGE